MLRAKHSFGNALQPQLHKKKELLSLATLAGRYWESASIACAPAQRPLQRQNLGLCPGRLTFETGGANLSRLVLGCIEMIKTIIYQPTLRELSMRC
jgi:hypothetical protein